MRACSGRDDGSKRMWAIKGRRRSKGTAIYSRSRTAQERTSRGPGVSRADSGMADGLRLCGQVSGQAVCLRRAQGGYAVACVRGRRRLTGEGRGRRRYSMCSSEIMRSSIVTGPRHRSGGTGRSLSVQRWRARKAHGCRWSFGSWSSAGQVQSQTSVLVWLCPYAIHVLCLKGSLRAVEWSSTRQKGDET